MKFKSLVSVAVATLALVSCAKKPGEVTKMTGELNDTTVTAVQITLSAQQIDTVVNLVDGKFLVELPADVQDYAIIRLLAGDNRLGGSYFISDGTELTVSFADKNLKVTSSMDYVQGKYAAYSDKVKALYEAEGENMMSELEALWMETVKANPDNAVAVLVVADSMYDLAPEKMLELIALIQEPVRSARFVASREKEANAQMNTKPGMKFTDFTVEHVYGYDRNVDPQPLKKEVKFSEYVGNGKYVLVDFWSPWCGPCRREMPNVKAIYNEYKDKGFDVISLTVWERQPQSHTFETAAKLEMDWTILTNCGSVPTDIYGVEGIPHLMLIGPDGTILKRGFHGAEGIRAAVEEYIK